jgi:hypothetical protein
LLSPRKILDGEVSGLDLSETLALPELSSSNNKISERSSDFTRRSKTEWQIVIREGIVVTSTFLMTGKEVDRVAERCPLSEVQLLRGCLSFAYALDSRESKDPTIFLPEVADEQFRFGAKLASILQNEIVPVIL